MYLVTGVSCLSVASLFFAVVLLGSRNPKHPQWASDAMVAYFYAPAMVGLTAVGLISLAHFAASLSQGIPEMRQLLAVAAILGITLSCFKLLGLRKRLAAYAAQHASAQILRPAAFTRNAPAEASQPPAKPTSRKLAA